MMRFIQAIMELLDRQEYISWKLPEDWHIILTANPDDGDYLVQATDIAQKTRSMSTYLKFDEEVWAKWAEENGVDGRCINFLLLNPEIVKGEVNARSLTMFFNSIRSFKDFKKALPFVQRLGEGSVGPEVATMFVTFIKNNLDKLISPKEMILMKDEKAMVAKATNSMYENGQYRADIGSVITTRLINFLVKYAGENPITPEILDRVSFLMQTEELIAEDLKFLLIKKLVNSPSKSKFRKVFADPKVQKYVI